LVTPDQRITHLARAVADPIRRRDRELRLDEPQFELATVLADAALQARVDGLDLGRDAEVALAVALGADHADRRLVNEVGIGAEFPRQSDGLGRATGMAVDEHDLGFRHGTFLPTDGLFDRRCIKWTARVRHEFICDVALRAARNDRALQPLRPLHAETDLRLAATLVQWSRDHAGPDHPRRPPMPADMPQPLDGFRIIDLTRVLSGPFCTMILGDLGADVIKVEAPEGDSVRTQGAKVEGLSWYFAGFNRNKRSVVLDLKSAEGKRALEALIADADALVENFRPGVLDRLGFTQARLQELRPGLVTAGISGFGADGPYKDRPAFDFIAQAMSGFMSTNGRAEDPPLRTGPPISDLVAGIYCALGVTAALLGRERNGGSNRVDVSMTGGMVSLLAYLAANYFATGEVPARTGNDHPIAAPYGLFPTKDEPIAVAPNDDVFFGRLMDALNLSDVKNDPAFASNPLRVANRARLNGLVEGVLRQHPAAHWIETLNAAGIPCGPVHDLAGTFADPQILSQHMAIDVPHPGHGVVRMVGFPIKLAHGACRVRHPAPDLGQHTAELVGGGGGGPKQD
jgi:CoA:oxalate CoA-transferase